MTDDAPQKNLWEVRKAGLNIMMSLGRRQAGELHRGLRRAAGHLAEYTDAPTRCSQTRQPRAPGTPCLGGHAACAADSGHAPRRPRAAPKMRAIAEEASALVRRYRGAYSGEHGDGLCRGEWIQWQFGPKITEAFAHIKQQFDPLNLLSPRRIVNPPKMDDTRLMRFPPAYRVIPLTPALDWSVWNVQNDAVTEQTTAPAPAATPAGLCQRRWRCATTTAIAASSTPAPCARATASRATKST